MKKNLRKLSALVLALVLSISLALPAAAADISAQEAVAKAYQAFGVKENEVRLLEVRKDRDDGRVVYEIEFAKDYDVKYSCEVLASSGVVVDREKDVSRNIFDKLELFFEVLFSQLFSQLFSRS